MRENVREHDRECDGGAKECTKEGEGPPHLPRFLLLTGLPRFSLPLVRLLRERTVNRPSSLLVSPKFKDLIGFLC